MQCLRLPQSRRRRRERERYLSVRLTMSLTKCVSQKTSNGHRSMVSLAFPSLLSSHPRSGASPEQVLELFEELGRGSYGAVFRANHKDGFEMAIKQIHIDVRDSPASCISHISPYFLVL